MTDREITQLVDEFCNQDESVQMPPDGFDDVDPVKFARAIVKKVKLNHGKRSLSINLFEKNRRVMSFLEKLNEAREKLTGKQFDGVLSAINFSVDPSEFDQERWEVKLFPNGGFGLRNRGDLYGINSTPIGTIEVSHTQFKKTMDAIQRKLLKGSVDLNATSFGIIHHDADGFHYTQKIPKQFSVAGQTLIMLPLGWAMVF